MKRRKKIAKPGFRRFMLPAAELLRFAALGIIGVTVALIGAFMSFKELIWPLFTNVGLGWDNLLAQALGVDDPRQITHTVGGLLLAAGAFIAYRNIRAFFLQLNTATGEPGKGTVVSGYIRKQQLARGPKIVALGGGTGLSTLLRGLKQYSSNITAIVTVSDDGGSSGRMIQDLASSPPATCATALSPSPMPKNG